MILLNDQGSASGDCFAGDYGHNSKKVLFFLIS
ncbi:MAG: hypothetical protein ACI9QD_000360, partial [Thermoproteota archaeon]